MCVDVKRTRGKGARGYSFNLVRARNVGGRALPCLLNVTTGGAMSYGRGGMLRGMA